MWELGALIAYRLRHGSPLDLCLRPVVFSKADFAGRRAKQPMTLARPSVQARLDALDVAVTSCFATAKPGVEHVRQRIHTAVADVRSLLKVDSQSEDYLVPFALMFLETAEQQFARAKRLIEHNAPLSTRVDP